ncbi:MAG: AAA family ATPase [Muribaculaceae bacterium]|nr:AAA family ATPase [Muribaculaceae bacterium]
MKFYNREIEIAELRRIRELAFTRNSRMTVVTGRRRIGKTSLVKKALADNTDIPLLYFFTARKTEAALATDFVREAREKLKIYIPDGLIKIADVIKYLFEVAKSRSFTIVIDEFQEFQNINPSVFSELQNLWDSYRQETKMNLVLSGSVLSMMKKIFTDAHEPLFGRADNIIRLKPFRIGVIKDILYDYNPFYSNEDLLALYSITGGIPKYIELLCDNGYITAEAMLKFTVSIMSPFIDEGRNLLITEFGRDYGTYFSILLTISEGKTTQSEITAMLGDVAIGGHLERLENTYNIITKYRPVFAKPNSKNTVRFRIADNFLQFWFRFIERNRSMIELDNYDDLTALILAQYPTYSGYMLERYFRQKLAEEGGFRELGSWWEPKLGIEASEIDIVGIKTDNRKALVAEVKRQLRIYDHKKFMAKIERIKNSALAQYEMETKLFTMEDM